MKPIVRALPVAIAFSIAFAGVDLALAQDSSVHEVGSPNPLQGLFTPQPQYPTPQSAPNPQPFVPGGSEANPIKNLFNIQPQYPNSQTQPFAAPNAPEGTTNHLQGFFTGQNPFQTPQTPINPQATPHALSPEFVKQAGDKGVPLTDREKDLIKHLSPEAQAAMAAAEDKEKAAASPTGSGEKAEDKDKTAAEKDGKDKTAEKDKDDKDKDKEKAEKDKDGKDKTAEKDKDKKEGEKAEGDKDKKDGEKAEGDKDKKDGEKAEGDKDKKDGEKAESDKDKDKDKTAKEEPPKVGPYNAMTEATFHLSAGDPQRCHSLVSKIISANPKHAQALYVRAVANVTMRKYPEAIADYRAVLSLVPGTELARLAQEGLRKLHY